MTIDLFAQRIETVRKELEWLSEGIMFFGAGILWLYLDRPEIALELRPTEDVDALVCLPQQTERSAQLEVHRIERELQTRGWSLDVRSHRRNQHAYLSPSGIAVDFAFDQLYPDDDWIVVARESAIVHHLPYDCKVKIPAPSLFLAAKIAASRNPKRWEGAYISHDIEDIALLMAGCSTLPNSVEVVEDERVRDYLGAWANELIEGVTHYGGRAYACLEANWPRQSECDRLDDLLGYWARLR